MKETSDRYEDSHDALCDLLAVINRDGGHRQVELRENGYTVGRIGADAEETIFAERRRHLVMRDRIEKMILILENETAPYAGCDCWRCGVHQLLQVALKEDVA